MNVIHSNREFALKFSIALVVMLIPNGYALAQGPCGGKPCPEVQATRIRKIRRTPAPVVRPPRTTVRGGNTRPVNPPAPTPEPGPVCEDAELVVVCGMPGCEMTLNGIDRNVTDAYGGIAFQVEANQKYRVRVAKPGYDPFDKMEEKLDCADERVVNVSLTAKPVTIHLRTVPAECDIYLDGQKQPAGSDAKGQFSYLLNRPTLLVEARRKGYLSATKNIILRPELANSEVVLALDPIKAAVSLKVNVAGGRVLIDDQKSPKPAGDRISLLPGPHSLTVDALGYAPVKLDFSVGPDETLVKDVQLERLPVSTLTSQASAAFDQRLFSDSLELCKYVFEVDQTNALAHRLAGQVYLERGDFANAGAHLAQALTGGEPVTLRIRRHPGEKFDSNRGHDLCEARLILGRAGLEFQGTKIATDNFTVSFDQIQVVGVQLKNNLASYLSTKVTANGKRRDFNFYSYDHEISQAGKPYLEMIQRLMVPH